MNLRKKKPHDSLYMLLDTMCNAFGGIILLAVLVVLLTNREKAHSGGAADDPELLQRRLALALTSLQQSAQLNTDLRARTNESRWRDQISMLSARQEAQNELMQMEAMIAQENKELDAANSADPSERLRLLNTELAAAQMRKLDAENSLGAISNNLKRLEHRISDMQRQVAAKVNDLQRPLRLPREHETGKRSLYVIVRYGHLYPCRDKDFNRNETDIAWTSTRSSEIAEPIRSKGIDPITYPQAAEAYFSSQSKDAVYLAFCVYEDSFPAFITARQIASDHGITYGWEPFRNSDGPVVFSENGHAPKAQ